jgi:hypothetical protein
MLTFLTGAWSFITSKWGMGIIIAGLVTGMWFLHKQLDETAADRDRASLALKNSGFKMDTTKTKDGLVQGTLASLQVTTDELKAQNSNLNSQLQNMGITMSQLLSATSIAAHSDFRQDSIGTHRDTTAKNRADTSRFTIQEGKYVAAYNDRFATFTVDVNLFPKRSPYLTNLNLRLVDSITLAHTTLRKRVWIFFHKVIGVQTHIVSRTPYLQIDRVEDYVIAK